MKEILYSASTLVLSLTGLCLMSQGAQAQEPQQEGPPPSPPGDSARVQVDTVRAPAAPRRGSRATAGPASVQAVRRRIRQIGGRGGGGMRRVVYPVIVPLVPTVVIQQQGEGRAYTATPRQQRLLGNGQQTPYSGYYYSPNSGRLGDDEGFYGPPGASNVRIRRGNGAEGEDSLLTPLQPPRGGQAVGAPGAPPLGSMPSVQRIERAILETGLFRASNVNFEFDQSTLLPASENTLDAVGEVLARYPALRIEVQGYTDAVGPAEYNRRLSQRRAEAVVRYMTTNFDIASSRLEARGYGEERPVASNANATGRTLNRRVTFSVLNPEAAEQYREESASQSSESQEEEGLDRETLRNAIREEMQRMRTGEEDAPPAAEEGEEAEEDAGGEEELVPIEEEDGGSGPR